MNEEQVKGLVDEFKGIVDSAMKETVPEIVKNETSEHVKAIMKQMKLDRALYGKDASGLDAEQKTALVNDLKNIVNGKLVRGEVKAALLESNDASGGYTVPAEVYAGIMRVAASAGLVARDAQFFPMSTETLSIPRYTGSDLEGSYDGEDEETSETSLSLGNSLLSAKEWRVIFRVSNALMADSSVEIADWFIGLIAEGMAVRLDKEAFKGGTFSGSPFVGILGSDDVTVHTMTTGKDTFAEFDLDEASDVIAQMPESLLNGAAWYMHRTVWAKVRTKKDTAGNYIVNQNPTVLMNFKKEGIAPAGEILGYPVFTTDQLPANSATAVSTKFAVFANLSKAIFVGTRQSLEIAQSDSATVGGRNTFAANQKAVRAVDRHAVAIGLPTAAVVVKTAAS